MHGAAGQQREGHDSLAACPCHDHMPAFQGKHAWCGRAAAHRAIAAGRDGARAAGAGAPCGPPFALVIGVGDPGHHLLTDVDLTL